jgi:hypothetical protein
MEFLIHSSVAGKDKMSRISLDAVAQAMRVIRALNLKQKEGLIDEIFLAQPHMLGSVLVLQKFGVSSEKMEFAIDLLILCFQAMKESGLSWPLIECASNPSLQRLSQKPSGPYNTAWNETAGNHDEHGAQSTFAR